MFKGSMEAQSLLGRLSAGQRCVLVSTWRQMRHQQAQLASLMRKILIELEQTEPTVKEVRLGPENVPECIYLFIDNTYHIRCCLTTFLGILNKQPSLINSSDLLQSRLC
jgi:hypothetical protein